MVSADMPIHDQLDYGIRLLEEERRRIARDLHDGPAQALTNISMRLDIVQQLFKTNPEMAMQELGRMNSRVMATINDIRRLIYDLRPVAIDEVGLIQAATDLCRRCERDWQVPIETVVPEGDAFQLSPAKQIALYRLLQEILNNVKKHAEATNIRVVFEETPTERILVVEDNGKGFDSSYVPAGHYGITGMTERAKYLGGALEIDSSPGRGSRITVRIPT